MKILPQPKFLYFDLGKVLVHFDQTRVCRQMADVARVPTPLVHEIIWREDRATRLELGTLTERQMYELFCEESKTRPDFRELCLAASNIFEINYSIVPLIGALATAGHRLGILSNTSRCHWELVADGRYGIVPGPFEQFVLSFEVGAMKPNLQIFTEAATAAGVAMDEIFFVDDLPANVQGAKAAGVDAVLFQSVQQLAAELHMRQVRFNL